jgi:HK97 family phage major capsid protein
MNIALLEDELRKKQAEGSALVEKTGRECQAHEEKDASGKVIAKGRLMTAEERQAIQAKLDDAQAIKARIDGAKNDAAFSSAFESLTAGMTPRSTITGATPSQTRAYGGKTPGRMFIESNEYSRLRKSWSVRGSAWSSGVVETPLWAATLTSDTASGGDMIVEDAQAGLVEKMYRPLVVADLIAQGTTDSNSISYMQEGASVNAAAAVQEGAAKPESTLIFTRVSDPVTKIATWIPVTDEMLEDAPATRSIIDNRLRLFVQLVEDDQILNGDGVDPNMTGIRTRAGLAADVVKAAAPENNADAILKQITAISTTAFLPPDGVVINPANWQAIQLLKDSNNNYIAGGPFAAPQARTLWGVRVVPTTAITAGTALVGAFQTGAQLFRKGGLRVEASNSHSDFFVKNLTAIRAEERAALAVYRPGAFGEVTSLT